MKKVISSVLALVFALVIFVSSSFTAFAASSYYINGVTVSHTSSSISNNCWTYANEIYKKIWGYNFSNNRASNDNMLRNISSTSELELTVANLRKYVSVTSNGAVIRTTSSDYLFAQSDSVGHSQIIVQIDSEGFTVLESNIGGQSREKYYTWNGYVQTWYNANHKFIKYIKWSGANAYNGYQPDPAPQGDYEYFPRCDAGHTSIVSALNSIGVDSSYNYRKQIAAVNGISNYSGTADQNIDMLNRLKAGTLKNPAKASAPSIPSVSYFPRCDAGHTSIVNALNSIGVDSSYNYRKQIAAANGISYYSGTADQNVDMLNRLKAGTLRRP